MAQEAKGKNGRILGSLNYFSLLNEKFPQKSLIKDKTKGNYFHMLGNSANKIKQVLSIPVIGAKIKEFLQGIVNTISNDIEAAAKSGCYATYENRKKLKECLDELKKFNFTVPHSAYDSIKKLRRLEDFHNKIIELNFKGEQYPVEVWLEWTGGKNILHIVPKIIFIGENLEYSQSGIKSEELVIKGFEQWNGNYKVFNSVEEGKQNLQVICKPEIKVHSNDKSDITNKVGLKVLLIRYPQKSSYTNEYDISNTIPLLSGWSQKNPADRMTLYSAERFDTNKDGIKEDWLYYKSEYFMNIAKHELGHVLGIKDAYTYEGDTKQYYSQYADLKEDAEQAKQEWINKDGSVNMAMNNTIGPILSNDIEMLILAWQSGKMQYFHLDNGGTEISEALGR